MTTHEIGALMEYLEFHLVSLCERMEPHIGPELTNELYQNAFDILVDIEDSINTVPHKNQHETR